MITPDDGLPPVECRGNLDLLPKNSVIINDDDTLTFKYHHSGNSIEYGAFHLTHLYPSSDYSSFWVLIVVMAICNDDKYSRLRMIAKYDENEDSLSLVETPTGLSLDTLVSIEQYLSYLKDVASSFGRK